MNMNMNSSNLKMAGITQNRKKRLIFIVVPQLRIEDGSRFLLCFCDIFRIGLSFW